jgi:hypothetical protein
MLALKAGRQPGALNERHLRRLLSDYRSYYHEDRTHLGLEKQTPAVRARSLADSSHQYTLVDVGIPMFVEIHSPIPTLFYSAIQKSDCRGTDICFVTSPGPVFLRLMRLQQTHHALLCRTDTMSFCSQSPYEFFSRNPFSFS